MGASKIMVMHKRKANGDTKCGSERKAFSNVLSSANDAEVTCKRCLASKPAKPATVTAEPKTPAQRVRALLSAADETYSLCEVRATAHGVTVKTPVMFAHVWVSEITVLLADFAGVTVK